MRSACVNTCDALGINMPISSGGRSSLGERLGGEEVEYARGSEGWTEFRGPDVGPWT